MVVPAEPALGGDPVTGEALLDYIEALKAWGRAQRAQLEAIARLQPPPL